MNRTYGIGSTVFEKWIIKRKLGEGSFGTVYEIQREDFGEVYKAALKVITVPQSDAEFQGALDEGMTRTQAEEYFYSVVEDIVREFAIMAKLKGTANVVSYEDHAVIRHKDGVGWDILIRMELLNPLLPYAYRHPMSRRDIICLGIDICKALELCQKYNVIHRDIKPENIFVSDNGDYKLGDFGIARTIERTMSGLSKKGTYNYMAPEVYRGREYGFSVDIYSLGIVLYRLLNQNRIPFLPQPPEPITFHQREEALARRMGGEMLPKPFYAEGRLAEIVQKACAYEPKERYSSPIQMRQELEAILYDEKDTEFIYPSGDELSLAENEYASSYGTEQSAAEELCEEDKEQTESAFGKAHGLQNAKDTGVDPRTMEPVYVARDPHEKAMQRALIQYRRPENYDLVKEALIKAGRNDLIGFEKHCLITPRKMDRNTSGYKDVHKKNPSGQATRNQNNKNSNHRKQDKSGKNSGSYKSGQDNRNSRTGKPAGQNDKKYQKQKTGKKKH